MLRDGEVATRLPATDLERARAFHSKGRGERGAWFRGSEGSLLGIGQAVP